MEVVVVGYAVVAVHPPTLTNGYISTSLLDLNSVQGNLIKNFLQTKSFEFPNSQNFDPCGPILIKVLLFAKNTSITINFVCWTSWVWESWWISPRSGNFDKISSKSGTRSNKEVKSKTDCRGKRRRAASKTFKSQMPPVQSQSFNPWGSLFTRFHLNLCNCCHFRNVSDFLYLPYLSISFWFTFCKDDLRKFCVL